MSNITAEMVKKLRAATGAGMMACKKALQEVGGDFDQAVDHLRKAGQAKAAKRSDKVAAEGQIVSLLSDDGRYGCLVDINSETDFVARDQSFQEFSQGVAATMLAHSATTLEAVVSLPFQEGSTQTVAERNVELAAKLGENIQIRRVHAVEAPEGGAVSTYIHGGRIGVLVVTDKPHDTAGKDVAMHIAAFHPVAISEDGVPADLLEREKAVFAGQADNSGKPPEILEKIVAGRLKKFLKEVSLLEQPFLKDTEKSVGEILKAEGVSVLDFVRFEVGEGIEKESISFSEEVMSQVQGRDQ